MSCAPLRLPPLAKAPRLLFLGPLLGSHPGWVVTQAEILMTLFTREGWEVDGASRRLSPLLRAADMVATTARCSQRTEVAVLQVFGGRSFLIEDLVSRVCRLLRLRLVMVLRGGAMPEFARGRRRYVAGVLGRADRIVVPSRYLVRWAEGLGLANTLIPNVIDLSRYAFTLRDELAPRLLWMRTFHPIYNPALAVRVLARLVAEVPGIALTMAGQEKGEGEAVRALARELGVAERIRFVGFLDSAGKSREAARADLFLNTNRVDNMPVSVLEACAFGLPVVATSVGGIPDLLEHEATGLLCPDDAAEAMAAAVLRLLREPGLARRLSANGRRLAESCAWEVVRPQWERVFREAMG